MIQVGTHGTNYITLTGESLDEGGTDKSLIALSASGWFFNLYPKTIGTGATHQDGLHKNAVLGKLKDALNNHHITEEIDQSEILEYMGIIEETV